MTGAEYIASFLSANGTTDAFGVPGGVILDLIYALDRQEGISPHLSYHEQSAGFAACGYAQTSGRIGVAYATRGPGFTNLLTAVADAYFDSVPVLFLTAHSAGSPPSGMRVMHDQEMDTCAMVRKITKYASRVDTAAELLKVFPAACRAALCGRKGAVFLDLASKVLHEEMPKDEICDFGDISDSSDAAILADELASEVRGAARPVVLVGDGVNQSGSRTEMRAFLAQSNIPCISSRFSHDIACDFENYFGYVGSHGIRAANFILSKADLVVSLGNRLNVPTQSYSFSKVLGNAKFLRYEIDESEFSRKLPRSTCRKCDIAPLIGCLCRGDRDFGIHDDWMQLCRELRRTLANEDVNQAVDAIARVMSYMPTDAIVVSDVGNHEFFVSRAAVHKKLKNRVLYSKSFGAMGSALGRSIGAYHATHKPVVCFAGDQGFQFNVQELQYISMHKIPIIVVLLNNGVSGMIRDKERCAYGKYLHVSAGTGFGSPCMNKLMESYGIAYRKLANMTDEDIENELGNCDAPVFIDCEVGQDLPLTPTLPRDRLCHDLSPTLPKDKFNYLERL